MIASFGRGKCSSLNSLRSRQVGRECLTKAAGADWWEWRRGSTPFFWRWPKEAQDQVLIRHPPWFIKSPPRYLKPQRAVQDPDMSILEKDYIAKGTVHSLTSFFSVPKGDSDIRMVYDATASGLNDCL
jgi:hypothetical protein